MAKRSGSRESIVERQEGGHKSEESPPPRREGEVRVEGGPLGRRGAGTTSSHTGGGTQESGMATGASSGESFGGATTALAGRGANAAGLSSRHDPPASGEQADERELEAKPPATIPLPKPK